MLGRGLYLSENKILPGIYVKCNFNQNQRTDDSIKIYAIKRGSNIALALTLPYTFNCTNDGDGNVTLSSTYGFSLLTTHDGEGNVTMEVKSK